MTDVKNTIVDAVDGEKLVNDKAAFLEELGKQNITTTEKDLQEYRYEADVSKYDDLLNQVDDADVVEDPEAMILSTDESSGDEGTTTDVPVVGAAKYTAYRAPTYRAPTTTYRAPASTYTTPKTSSYSKKTYRKITYIPPKSNYNSHTTVVV